MYFNNKKEERLIIGGFIAVFTSRYYIVWMLSELTPVSSLVLYYVDADTGKMIRDRAWLTRLVTTESLVDGYV